MKLAASRGGAVGATPAHAARAGIEEYYDQTWNDYRFLWLNRRNLAFHFGYHDDTTRGHAEALLNTNRILATRAALQSGYSVLDAGCGVGGTSLWLAEHRGAHAVGLTLVRSQVVHGSRLAAQRGLAGRARFLQADYTQIPCASGSFHSVWAVESLCHAANKAPFYQEAARVLRPGGRLVVAEYMRAARPLDAAGEHLVRQWLAGWAIPDLDTPDEHVGHAAAAGLVAVTFEDFTAYTRRSLRRLYRIAWATYPLAWIARVLRLRSATQHGNVIAALRQYQALESGYWRYGLLSATKL